jgi:molecular chaperone GrpE
VNTTFRTNRLREEREERDMREERDETAEPGADRQALTRAVRDLEATQARVKQNAARVYEDTRTDLVVQLLPVLDNLDRTIEATRDASDQALLSGVEMVRGQLEAVLIQYGLERYDAVGEPFDPSRHEAIALEPVRDPALLRRVVKQLAPGYRLGERVLRAAKVTVGAR